MPRTVSQSISRVPARRMISRCATVAPMASSPPTTIPMPSRLALRVIGLSLVRSYGSRLHRGSRAPKTRSATALKAATSPVVAMRCRSSVSPAVRPAARPERVEQVLRGQRGGEGGVDHGHPGAGAALDQRPQQRVVRAAQQQGVDLWIGRQQLIQVAVYRRLGPVPSSLPASTSGTSSGQACWRTVSRRSASLMAAG